MTQKMLDYHVDAGMTPLTDPEFGEERVFVPECLQTRLFPDVPKGSAPQFLYALLDAGKIPFLLDRLGQAELDHVCLYDFDDFDDDTQQVAPWLVRLTADSDITRQFFSFDADDDNPFHMLVHGGGILLRSHADIAALRGHLRHYTVLPDEGGVRMVFRMQEPGYLDAFLAVSSDAEIATFFSHVLELTYLLPSLEDGKWDAISVRAPTVTAQNAQGLHARPKLDKARRDNLRHMRNLIQARALAVKTGADLADREARADTYYKILMTGYDNEPTVIRTHDLLRRVPEGALQPYWDAVRSGDHSLGYLNHRLAAHYGLEDLVQ
ncbi:DUF4123 domain-containing protein [Ascidiaceihabitans sp.]|uniref:DUF4123 domain-containing protein n=1 Tax=Ascidiaceihabitans sp. TaxID=1872644 RepID=UPI0032984277